MSFDWPLKRISEVANFENNKRIPLKSLDREKRQGIYPYYGASGVVDHIDDFIFDGRYLLISEDGENLRTRNTPIAFQASGKFWVNNHAHILSEKEEGILDYLEYYFSVLNIGAYITGAVQPKLNKANLDKIEIPIPPKDERLKLNNILNSLKYKVALNSETNQTLEQMAQAIFKSWFVDFDPVKAKMNGEQPEGMDTATASLFPEKLVESELGLIPDGWDACLIENVTSKVFSGGTPATKNDEFWGGDLPWLSSGETRNNFIIETEKYITEAGVKGSSTKASAYGDILIASAGQGHTRGQTSFNSIDCYINQSIVALRAATNVSAYWLYYCLERRYDEMRSVSDSHSSRGSLTTKLLKGMPAIMPSKDIVNAFDSLVEPLVRKQIANSNQNTELSALRDTLLPKLLSGELTLD
ncbi:restriction endonuclease subunit S [Photobacterium leiognathi]|uniref:restriction endonuclease subunit S n=1 Tax=Photobacterium leiognathi TaxID=553611 RepID=UPI002980FD31|nr:restriction endonuclease subunit S [Photobacterium leiognathi]